MINYNRIHKNQPQFRPYYSTHWTAWIAAFVTITCFITVFFPEIVRSPAENILCKTPLSSPQMCGKDYAP